MKIQSIITQITLASLMILVGCSAGLQEENASEQATFLNSKVKVYESREVSDSNWSIPVRVEMTLTTCLTEALYGKNIIGQKFEITGDNLQTEATSDDKGCIYWQDSVRFDYLSPEREMVVNRTVTGLGDFQGSKDIILLVNPWNKTVVDGSIKSADTQFSSLSRIDNIKTLYISSVGIKFLEEKHSINRAELTAQISFEPKMTRLTSSGEMAPYKNMKNGEFNITAIIYEVKENGKTEAISTPSTINSKFDNGRIEEEVKFNIFKTPSTDGSSTLKLGLRVSPNRNTAPHSLTDIEGFTTIRSDFRSDSGTFMIAELPSTSFNKAFESSSNADSTNSQFGFSIEDLKISFGGYTDEHNGTASSKKINSNYTVCLKNNLTKQSIGEVDFSISILDEDKKVISNKVRTSKMSGCVTASFERNFNLNNRRETNYIKHYMLIEGGEGLFQGFTRERAFFVNPWEPGSLFAHTQEDELPPTNPNAQEAEIFVSNFSLQYRSNDESKYRLNENMDMSFVKIYRAEFNPQIDRGHMLNGERRLDNLYSGKLNMRLMILAPKGGNTANLKEMATISKQRVGIVSGDLENYTFITGSEKTVTIDRDGKVKADLDLVFNSNNLKYISSRTYAVVELSSSDDEEMKSVVFTSPVMLASIGSSTSTISDESMVQIKKMDKSSELSKLFAKIETLDGNAAPRSNWKLKSFDLFEKLLDSKTQLTTVLGLNNLTFKSKEKISGYNNFEVEKVKQLVTTDEFEAVMNIEKNKLNDGVLLSSPKDYFSNKNKVLNGLKSKLCSYFYKGKNVIKTYSTTFGDEDGCNANPTQYLNVKGIKFVQEITKQPVRSQGSLQKSINFSTNNNNDVSGRWSEFWGWRASWGFKVTTFGLDAIGLSSSAGFDANYGQSWSNNKGTGESVSFGESNRLELEEIVLNFEAKTRSCVLIKATKNNTAIRLCEAQDNEEEVSESWYVMNESWRRLSYVADPGTENDLRLFKVVRGQVKFSQFKNLIEASNNQIFLTSKKGRSEINQYMSALYQSEEGDQAQLSDANFPGTLE